MALIDNPLFAGKSAPQLGAMAMLSQAPSTDIAPSIPKEEFIQQKNNGADVFKNYAMSNVTTDDVDQKLLEISTKKDSAYADSVKYFKSI
jgi:hypothetical protein